METANAETIASVPGWAHQIHTKQFKIYANALSKIMKESNNQLHFYLVGACDGLQDDSFEEVTLLALYLSL